MKIKALFFAVIVAVLVAGCSTAPTGFDKSGSHGEVGTRANGISNPPIYVKGDQDSSIGYVKACFSKTSPKPPATKWYLDGVFQGSLVACKSAKFKIAGRGGHTVSFTCAANHKRPDPVKIDLKAYQKATIHVYYK